jgi:hypothetical protein
MLTRLSVASVIVLAIFQSAAWSCTCSFSRWGCNRNWIQGDVIFLGKVTANIDLEPPAADGVPRNLSTDHEVHFSIADSFRGGDQVGQEIVVHTGSGGGDCGYPFAVGASYVVYASGPRNSLYTSICTATTPAVMAAGVLRELRALRDRLPTDSLSGMVGVFADNSPLDDWTKVKPLKGVTVRVIDASSQIHSAITDEEGVYIFHWLPPGTYRMEEDLPAGLKSWPWPADKARTLDIHDKQTSGPGCAVYTLAVSDGQTSGIVERHRTEAGNAPEGGARTNLSLVTGRPDAGKSGSVPR